jgi:hypothetical protein
MDSMIKRATGQQRTHGRKIMGIGKPCLSEIPGWVEGQKMATRARETFEALCKKNGWDPKISVEDSGNGVYEVRSEGEGDPASLVSEWKKRSPKLKINAMGIFTRKDNFSGEVYYIVVIDAVPFTS